MRLAAVLVFFTGVVQQTVLAAPGSACSSGIYKALLPLANYAPPESYCSAHYPPSTVTVTVTAWKKKREAATIEAGWDKRQPATKISSTTTKASSTSTTMTKTKAATTTTTKTSTTTSLNAQQSQWSSLLSMAGKILQTVCSCIEAPVTITVCNLVLEEQHHIESKSPYYPIPDHDYDDNSDYNDKNDENDENDDYNHDPHYYHYLGHS